MNGLNNFVKLPINEPIPDDVFNIIKEHNGFNYNGISWFHNISFQRGKDFIIVTDDGGYYKVDAEWMIWSFIDGQFGSQAIWSNTALENSITSLMLTGKRTNDPDYQT
jgi:hypothetical protein